MSVFLIVPLQTSVRVTYFVSLSVTVVKCGFVVGLSITVVK